MLAAAPTPPASQKYAVAGTLKGILSMAGKMMDEDGAEQPTAPEEIAGVNIARLLRNLEETSYNEGAMDLACRLSDCHAVIKALLAAPAPLSHPTGDLPPLPEYFGISEAEKERAHAYAVNYARAAIALHIASQPTVDLTDEQIIEIADKTRTAESRDGDYILPISFARAIARAAIAAYLARQAKAEQPATGLESENELISMARMKQIRDGIRQQDGMDGDDWDFALVNAVAASLARQAQGVPEGWREFLEDVCESGKDMNGSCWIPRAKALLAEVAPAGAQNAEAIRNQALEEAAKLCDEICSDYWDQYKGRGKHAPNNPNRANSHTEGVGDGADMCSDAIRALQTGSANTQEGGAFSSEESNELAAYGIDSRKLVKIGELPTQNACAYEGDDGSNCECGWPKKTCRNYARAEKGQNHG
jgi:hypothetical protein